MAEEPSAKRPRACGSCDLTIVRSPLPEDLRAEAYRCMCDVYLGDFKTNGLGEDQFHRMAQPGAIYALARPREGQGVAATAMLAFDGSVGILGGVSTRQEFRGQGLARGLLSLLMEEVQGGPRWLVLGTGSRTAARIYASHGFSGLNGTLDGGEKGYNPDDEGEWTMVRDAQHAEARDSSTVAKGQCKNQPFDLAAYVVPGTITVEPLQRRHWGGAVLLLNAVAGHVKMGAFGIDNGLNAEQRLAQAFRDGDRAAVAVHSETRRVYGLAFRDPKAGLEVYNLGPHCVATALVAGLPSTEASLEGVPRALLDFWERGYLVFPGLLADEAAKLRGKMDELMSSATETTANWNAVDSDGAQFVLGTDDSGKPVPGKVFKVQGAALQSAAVLEALASPKVQAKVRELYGFLGQEVPEHVDVFGTKFFPMWPGGTSVSWHQDCHFFGTGSPYIISCGVYLEDTDTENGCLQVIPGSHARGKLQHEPGTESWSQGEWVAADTSAAVDVVVPAGSVVLFNAMLMHAARRNSHSSRTRYSLFGHYVPASLSFAWRGTDFSHGTYKDRHNVY